MAAMYGHAWVSQYGSQPSGIAADTWATVLSGLSGQQLAAGLGACAAEGNEFPPGAPRFRAMCLGIPSFAYVRKDTGPVRSPFTWLVWQYLNGYDFRQASSDRADRMLREAYELACEHVMRGGELPKIPAALIRQEKRQIKPATQEAAQAALAKVRALLDKQKKAAELGHPLDPHEGHGAVETSSIPRNPS